MKVLICILAALLGTMWPSAAAVAFDITFDDVMSVGNPLVTVLDTQGYRFTGSFRTIDSPGDSPGAGFASNGSAVYLGQEGSTTGITVTRVDGGSFALYEFDAAGLHALPTAGSPNAREVSLVGLRAGGDVLSASYGMSGLASFAHFSVPATWHDLRAVTFAAALAAGAPGALALDDVGVGEGPVPTNVPEPSTLALALLAGLGGVTVAALRRRPGVPVRHR